jgi:type IV secretory pathway VirB10-like protein
VRLVVISLVALAIFAAAAMAQQPAPTPQPKANVTRPPAGAKVPKPAQPAAQPDPAYTTKLAAAPGPATPAVQPAPMVPPGALSHEEQVEIENIMLKSTMLNRDYNDLVQRILMAHPGYYWNQQTNSLIPVPKTPPPTK